MLRAGYSLNRCADRIVIDDRLQRDRVVGVDPERDLLVTRATRNVGAANRVDVADRAARGRSEARGSRRTRRARTGRAISSSSRLRIVLSRNDRDGERDRRERHSDLKSET